MSVTYQTSSGVRTRPVQPGTGAYLIVTPVSHVPGWRELGAGDAEFRGAQDDRLSRRWSGGQVP